MIGASALDRKVNRPSQTTPSNDPQFPSVYRFDVGGNRGNSLADPFRPEEPDEIRKALARSTIVPLFTNRTGRRCLCDRELSIVPRPRPRNREYIDRLSCSFRHIYVYALYSRFSRLFVGVVNGKWFMQARITWLEMINIVEDRR